MRAIVPDCVGLSITSLDGEEALTFTLAASARAFVGSEDELGAILEPAAARAGLSHVELARLIINEETW